jgi:hypothetical protein
LDPNPDQKTSKESGAHPDLDTQPLVKAFKKCLKNTGKVFKKQ